MLKYLILLLFLSGCSTKYIIAEYPHEHRSGFRYNDIPLKYENSQSLGDFVGEFCNRYSILRAEHNITPHECLRNAGKLKFKFYDRMFHPSKAYDDYEKNGNFPFRIYEGIYQTTGFVSVHAKGVNFGDTALAHELVHAYDHIMKIHKGCADHKPHCGWDDATWKMIDDLDQFAGRGNHNWNQQNLN
jgi:hypothetical protein